MVKDLGPVVKQAVVNDVVAVLAILTSCLIGQKMRKQLLIAAIATIGLIGSAYAQPSTNGPSGTGPEGTSKSNVSGSGTNPPGSSAATSSGTKHSTKHSKQKHHSS
jgi:hypothetical protein